MKVIIAASSFLFCAQAPAQESIGNDGDIAQLTAIVHALGKVEGDVQKDSISELLKQGLRTLLEAENAFVRDLAQLPLTRADAPDGKFRLITWNVPHADGSHRFEGLLLVQDKKRRVLHELHDMTEKIPSPTVPVLGPDNWYGALYYAVVPVKKGAKTYYTLLGWKGYSRVETRKVIDVLGFKGPMPQFGAPLFGEGRLKQQRIVFGYSFQVSMSLKWDDARQWIVCDHLSPTRQDLEGQWAFYGPDLSYDAYVWDKGHWNYRRDIDARDMERDGKPYNQPPKNTP